MFVPLLKTTPKAIAALFVRVEDVTVYLAFVWVGVGPVGPVAPVAPVTPLAPVGPVAPTAPVGPAAPFAPVAPTAPVGTYILGKS